ncbi:hypothetical protein SNEBB_010010 [Seison nebaliae]|nr:hypothetical protein SNEBB_010010 [Seison nebaliae]
MNFQSIVSLVKKQSYRSVQTVNSLKKKANNILNTVTENIKDNSLEKSEKLNLGIPFQIKSRCINSTQLVYVDISDFLRFLTMTQTEFLQTFLASSLAHDKYISGFHNLSTQTENVIEVNQTVGNVQIAFPYEQQKEHLNNCIRMMSDIEHVSLWNCRLYERVEKDRGEPMKTNNPYESFVKELRERNVNEVVLETVNDLATYISWENGRRKQEMLMDTKSTLIEQRNKQISNFAINHINYEQLLIDELYKK